MKIDVFILPINDFHDVVLYEYNAQWLTARKQTLEDMDRINTNPEEAGVPGCGHVFGGSWIVDAAEEICMMRRDEGHE